MTESTETAGESRTANLILVEQSGAKRQIPQLSTRDGMIGAKQAMRHPGLRLREIKVVQEHTAVARWRASELGWRRVA